MLFMVLILIKILSNWFYFFLFPFCHTLQLLQPQTVFFKSMVDNGWLQMPYVYLHPVGCEWTDVDWWAPGPTYILLYTRQRGGPFPGKPVASTPPPLYAYARTQTLTHVRRYILCTQSSPQQVRAFAKNNKKRLAGVNYIIIVNICVF